MRRREGSAIIAPMSHPTDPMPPMPVSDTARDPGDLARFAPEGAARVLDCSANDPARWAALRERGARELHAVAPEGTDGPDVCIAGIDALLRSQESGCYDAVFCDHVVERQRNPVPLLERLHALLVPGGALIVATPNMQYHKAVRALAEGWWVYGDTGVWQRGNLRFFTATSLRDLCIDHGFKVSRCLPRMKDPESAFPLDDRRYAHAGRISVGPLDAAEYASYLAPEIICLATKPEA
ncbi:MAG: methyltransferase domain-containing protein [Candidatus Hydrogenedens sp.]|nr:methyltransferase domain-containing protein [Candidatus Hydrogenedens sp.]